MKNIRLTWLNRWDVNPARQGLIGLGILLGWMMSVQPGWAAETRPCLTAGPSTRPAATQKVSERVHQYLDGRVGDSINVWVFFIDKGFSDRSSFEERAGAVPLTDRARQRRAKVSRDQVLFVDLPVERSYLEAVVSTGGRLRVVSRWLNAASFRLAKSGLEAVAELPFVAEVKPVALFRRTPGATVGVLNKADFPESPGLSPEALDYGLSEPQLSQLNVPAMHQKGLSGAGVTLTITDTGFRRTHPAFVLHNAESRILAEYDFVNDDGNTANEGADPSNAWNHGTGVWSLAGGYDDGRMYGPAYRANFILCKTEDVADEYQQEEDFWVAALEFADSIGTDVITTSLGYSDWYTFADFDGETAVISIAAGTCDGLGIVMLNSMGNSGPAAGTLTAPADAFDILSIGSVDRNGVIANNSSRGPTADGRIKPDVCARGVSAYIAEANPGTLDEYVTGSGTSYATPLVAGLACLLIEAHPDWTPSQVREAIRSSGNNHLSPNNTYGWGIPDAALADSLVPECCLGQVGDVNGDGADQPSVGDISRLIDYLFISQAPLECYGEADIDLSGALRPTAASITLVDITQLIDHVFISDTPTPDCLAH